MAALVLTFSILQTAKPPSNNAITINDPKPNPIFAPSFIVHPLLEKVFYF
jgi:hypothetical protein